MTKISCVIVCYNNEKYIANAIESVLKQSRPVDEIIISDDASTDGSKAIIQSYVRDHSYINACFRESNVGVALNRDGAIRKASGELITLLDGDDWYYPGKVAAELECFEKNDVVLAYSDIKLFWTDSLKTRYWDMSKVTGETAKSRLAWLANRKGVMPTHYMFKKQLFVDAGGFDSTFLTYEDLDLDIRMAALPGVWAYSGKLGAAYRQTREGLSSSALNILYKYQKRSLVKNKLILKKHLGGWGVFEARIRLLGRLSMVPVKRVVNYFRS